MFFGCLFVAVFFLLMFVVGYGAVALVLPDPAFHTETGALRGGVNLVAIYLSQSVGGDALMGFIAAVAFATVVAVVGGLALSGASAVSHDIYARVLDVTDERREVQASRVATVLIGALSVGLGLVFRTENAAVLVGLGLCVAASANVPVLLLATRWRGLTASGAVAGGSAGLVSAVALTVLGPDVWVTVLGHATAVFPIDPPALVSMPLAYATAYAVSRFK